MTSLAGMFDFPASFLEVMRKSKSPVVIKKDIPDVSQAVGYQFAASKIESLMWPHEVKALLDIIAKKEWFPVGINGYQNDYKHGDVIGSWRLRTHSDEFAKLIWQRLRPHMSPLLSIPEGSSKDSQGALTWRAIGISPLLRFIKYEDKGSLVAHYDSPFVFDNGCTTLKSLVLYLTDSAQSDGGQTRYVRDLQDKKPALQRDYGDWSRSAQPDEVIASVLPIAGNGLVFDHRILHDSSPITAVSPDRPKIIIRTDVIYQGIKTPCAG